MTIYLYSNDEMSLALMQIFKITTPCQTYGFWDLAGFMMYHRILLINVNKKRELTFQSWEWQGLSHCRLAPREFNSYGSRRGNDAVMARGTFANIRLVNKFMGKAGPKTIHIPSGDTVREISRLDSFLSAPHPPHPVHPVHPPDSPHPPHPLHLPMGGWLSFWFTASYHMESVALYMQK